MRRVCCGLVLLFSGLLALACSSSQSSHDGAGASPALPKAGQPGMMPDGGEGGSAWMPQDGYCRDTTASLIAAAGDPAEPAAPLTEQAIAGSACNAVERSYALADSTHVPPCSAVAYATNPPSSGHHYGNFPQYAVYEYAIPRGFWVHPMEHGGIVFTYSCTDCADEVAAATTLMASTAVAPACCSASGCPASATNQLLMTPDPGIPTRWAAASWGFTLTADCFEPGVFADFIAAHRDSGLAPELICSNTYATDVTQPGPE